MKPLFDCLFIFVFFVEKCLILKVEIDFHIETTLENGKQPVLGMINIDI